MPVESAADRASFLNPDEFGCRAAYNHDGAETLLDGIFDRPFLLATAGDDSPGVGTREASFQVSEADLPPGAEEGDVLSITTAPTDDLVGSVWKVVGDIERDGTGFVTLSLEVV